MNSSKELCKLLGVEPIYTDGEQILTEEQYCQKPMRDIDRAMYWRSSFPDLTKPSNFVKLLEDIKIDGIELCDWLICYSGSFCNRQDFIDSLIELIEEYTNIIGGLTQDIKKIKQQAQQVGWEY